jgi:hypothetical protein
MLGLRPHTVRGQQALCRLVSICGLGICRWIGDRGAARRGTECRVALTGWGNPSSAYRKFAQEQRGKVRFHYSSGPPKYLRESPVDIHLVEVAGRR